MARVRVDRKHTVRNPDNSRTVFLPREESYVVTRAQAGAIELAGAGEWLDRDAKDEAAGESFGVRAAKLAKAPTQAAAPAKAKRKK